MNAPIDLSAYTQEQIDTLMRFLPLIEGKTDVEIAQIINQRAGRLIDISAISIKGIINQVDITIGELEEVRNAAEALVPGSSKLPENQVAIRALSDAIADVQVSNLGQAARLPIDIPTEYFNVALANLTRIPQSVEEAEATVEKWKAKGIECVISRGVNPDGSETFPVLTANCFQTSTDGERFSPNKFVKGVNTILPINYDLMEEVTFVE